MFSLECGILFILLLHLDLRLHIYGYILRLMVVTSFLRFCLGVRKCLSSCFTLLVSLLTVGSPSWSEGKYVGEGFWWTLSEENHDNIRHVLVFHYTFDLHCFPSCLFIDWWFSARTNINWQISWSCLSFFADRFGVSDSVIFGSGRPLIY